jgi:hypothetical protein
VGASGEEPGALFRELEVAPLAHRLASTWEWGMPASFHPFPDLDQAWVSKKLPASVSILHMSLGDVDSCEGTGVLLTLYKPVKAGSKDGPVTVDVAAAFPNFQVGNVEERGITMGASVDTRLGRRCLQQAGVVAVAANGVCALGICLRR